MQIQIKITDLKQSPRNIRQVKRSKEGMNYLAASIKSKGLLHNLVVVKSGSGYEVIDGNRRLEAYEAYLQRPMTLSFLALCLMSLTKKLAFTPI